MSLISKVNTESMIISEAFMGMNNIKAKVLIDNIVDAMMPELTGMLQDQKLIENLHECKDTRDMKNIPEPHIMTKEIFDLVINKIDALGLSDVAATCLAMECMNILKTGAGQWVQEQYKQRAFAIMQENQSRIIKPTN